MVNKMESSIPEENSLDSLEGLESPEFNIETPEGRVEAYYNQQMGRVEEKKQKIKEMFGVPEGELDNIERYGVLIATKGGGDFDGAEKQIEYLNGLIPSDHEYGGEHLRTQIKELQEAIEGLKGKEYAQVAINFGKVVIEIASKRHMANIEIQKGYEQRRGKEVKNLEDEIMEIVE